MNEPDGELLRREHSRHTVQIKARIMENGQGHDCRIVNISAGGAKLLINHQTNQGAAVQLEIGSFGQFNCTIVWQHGSDLGVKFNSDPAGMAEIIMGLALYG